MRLPKRGERGFTLIELLIVVAILGVLAAVVIPNVTRLFGRGEEEAAKTELHNVQAAVTNLMVDNGIVEIEGALGAGSGEATFKDMNQFPDAETSNPIRLLFAGAGNEVPGYRLYGNQVIVDLNGNGTVEAGDGVKLVNYVSMNTTAYRYTCETDGTVKQWPIDMLVVP